MTDDEDDAGSDELSRGRDGLVGFAGVVGHDHLDPFAEHAALGVEVRDRAFGADLVTGPGPRHVAGQRRGQTDQHLGADVSSAGNQDTRRRRGGASENGSRPSTRPSGSTIALR